MPGICAFRKSCYKNEMITIIDYSEFTCQNLLNLSFFSNPCSAGNEENKGQYIFSDLDDK